MGIAFIRKTYGVPAKVGARVEYCSTAGPRKGTITGTRYATLRIRLDGEKRSGLYHPKWNIRYLPEGEK